MSLAVTAARNQIAGTLRGGADDIDVKANALDALSMAMSELNTKHLWDFKLTATVLTTTAGTGDYSVPSGLQKVYSVRYGTTHPLFYASERIDERLRADQTQGTPTHYNMFAWGATGKMRLMPIPAGSAVLVTVSFYNSVTVPTATAGAASIDLPNWCKYWPIYKGKALLLADENGAQDRQQYWQALADQLFQKMKHMDRWQPDEDLAFVPRSVQGPQFPADHGWRRVQEFYGY
jgi:hypothetical protein